MDRGIGGRPTDPRTEGHLGGGGGGSKGRGAPRGVAGPAPVKRDPGSRGRPRPARIYLLPRTERSVERTGPTAQAPLEAPARAPRGPAAAPPRDPGLGAGGGPGLPPAPRPGPQGAFVLASAPLLSPGAPRSRRRASAGRSEGKPGARLPRPHSAAPTRVQGGRESARRGRAPGSPPLPPRGPSEAQKGAHCPPGNTFLGAE